MEPTREYFRLLEARLEREKRARLSAESIAESATAQLYSQQRRLILMEKIAVAANSATQLEDAAQQAIDLVCEYTRWPVGHLYLVEDRHLVSAAIWHLADPTRHAGFREVTERTTFAVGKGLPGRVLASGNPAWIPDVTLDANFPRAQSNIPLDVRAAFAFPILAGNDVVAVAEFFSTQTAEPDEALLAVMRNVGTQLGRVFERKRAERKLIFDALHDGLTSLPNRTLFLDRVGHALARTKRQIGAGFAVLFIDADRFKIANDSLGHSAGDQLLQALGHRLSECIRQCDTIARFAGDEFAVLLEDVQDARDALVVAERIHSSMQNPFKIGIQEIFLTVSIGIGLSAPEHERPEELLRDADIAMYRAKAEGKARHSVFSLSMHKNAMKVLHLENDLRRAIERRELCLFYQPIVAMKSKELLGFEALIRWRHPDRGMVSPAEFIPLAEETGLILPIGEWVIAEACRQLSQWKTPGDQLTVSVNVAARQFAEPNLVSNIVKSAALARIDITRLKLELTESAVIQHEGAEAMLAELTQLGVKLLLDDFGTGYSSLSHLHRFPMSTIKIDGSFIRGITSSPKNAEIVRAIILIARTLGMDVIAEGVETKEQLDLLGELGCEIAQGYLFSRPVEAKIASDYIENGCPWQKVAVYGT